MSKPVVQYIDAAVIEQLLRESGYVLLPQAGFVKVMVADAPAHAPKLYVAKSKRVGRIDLSGFGMPEGTEGIVFLDDDLAFGNVKQQIDFTRNPEATLKTLKAVLKALSKAPVPEKAARKAPKAKASEAKGWQTLPSTPAGKADRKAAIAEAAKRQAKKGTKGAKAAAAVEPEAQADVTETPIAEEAVNETPAEAIPAASTTL